MFRHPHLFFTCLLSLAIEPTLLASPKNVSFSQSAGTVDAYDYVQITAEIAEPDAHNPFTDASLSGTFRKASESARKEVGGFCDSPNGSVFRVRFMPSAPGEYFYSITYHQGEFTRTHSGRFNAVQSSRRGIVRVDAQYPWHFLWEGTGEHFFWNGTTTYWLMGWRDEEVIRAVIDRLHRLKVNRMRVLLAGRSDHTWSEPIVTGRAFTFSLNPWLAERPEDVSNPGFDFSRFNLEVWERFEHMLTHARQKDMIISVVFDIGDSPVHPAEGSDDELRYFRYAVDRFAAFSNVNWDLGNGSDWYRKWPTWAEQMGTLIKRQDPYGHLTSVHTEEVIHQPRVSAWFDMTLFQWWARPLHDWMVAQREEQVRLGRIIPQVNEEYGYEEHYPHWSPNFPDGQSAEANRRAAWEIAMAGCYQTTGETAKRGTGAWPDTGGGWVNGRGDESMTMLNGYAHMVDFFTSFEWWKTNPNDELVRAPTLVPGAAGQSDVRNRAFCLAETGRLYAVYLPMGGMVTIELTSGTYEASWYNPRTGEWKAISHANGPRWTAPPAPGDGDWALLLKLLN